MENVKKDEHEDKESRTQRFKELFIKDPSKEIDVAALESKFRELETIMEQKGNPKKFVEMVRRSVEKVDKEWSEILKKSSFNQMTSSVWIEERRVDWSGVIEKGVNLRIELAPPGSKKRREEIVKEYNEKPGEFLKMVQRNAKKLKGWDTAIDPGSKRWMYKEFHDLESASKVVAEIACERGLTQTSGIVDEMIRIHKHTLLENYADPVHGKEWIFRIVSGKSSPSPFRPHQRIDKIGAESRTAYSIVGLNEGGLPLALSAQVGSVNTRVGLEVSKILLETILEMKKREKAEFYYKLGGWHAERKSREMGRSGGGKMADAGIIS